MRAKLSVPAATLLASPHADWCWGEPAATVTTFADGDTIPLLVNPQKTGSGRRLVIEWTAQLRPHQASLARLAEPAAQASRGGTRQTHSARPGASADHWSRRVPRYETATNRVGPSRPSPAPAPAAHRQTPGNPEWRPTGTVRWERLPNGVPRSAPGNQSSGHLARQPV